MFTIHSVAEYNGIGEGFESRPLRSCSENYFGRGDSTETLCELLGKPYRGRETPERATANRCFHLHTIKVFL